MEVPSLDIIAKSTRTVANSAMDQAAEASEVAGAAVRLAIRALDAAKMSRVHSNWLNVLADGAERAAAAEAAVAAPEVGRKRKYDW